MSRNSNSIFKLYYSLKDILTYKPPQYPKPFVLEETQEDLNTEDFSPERKPKRDFEYELKAVKDNLKYVKELAGFFETIKTELKNTVDTAENESISEKIAAEIKKISKRKTEFALPLRAYDNALNPKERIISSSLCENEKIIKELYNFPLNADLTVHHFEIAFKNPVKAMLISLDGMVDTKTINMSVLKPLMTFELRMSAIKDDQGQIEITAANIIKRHLTNQTAKTALSFKEVTDAVNRGDAALFIEGVCEAVLIDVKGFKTRAVEKPKIEESIQGAQSSFTEVLKTNTSILRAIMPTNDLVNEIIPVGERISVNCSIMYLKSLTNPNLVNEVRRRIKGIKTDYLIDIGMLEQFIVSQPNIFFPRSFQTERPDRTAYWLAEGRVVIFLNGAPFALVVPATFFSFFHFIEDYGQHVVIANISRITRIVSMFVATLLPALYIACSYFHQEAIPTYLALAIASSREKIPFSAIGELLIMEISFEIVREAVLRVPGILGSTIGILGAIILGQSIVAANLVSSVVVVLVAITGVASFSIPDYRMAAVLRILRFFYLIPAYYLGFAGIAMGLFVVIAALCYTKSFGVPYLAPVAGKTWHGFDTVLRGPIFRQERRPDFLNPKDNTAQPHISRRWNLKNAKRKAKNKNKPLA